MSNEQSIIVSGQPVTIPGQVQREIRRQGMEFQLISGRERFAMGELSMIQTHAEHLVGRTAAVADLIRKTTAISRKLTPEEEAAHHERFQTYLTLMNKLTEAAGVEIVLAANMAPNTLVSRSLPDAFEEIGHVLFG